MSVVIGLTFINEVAEGEHVYDGILKNLLKCRRVGITDAALEVYGELLGRGRKERDRPPKRPDGKVKRARAELHEQVAAYRTAADLVAGAGREAARERDLLVDGPAPRTDSQLVAYLAGLDEVMKKHAAALAQRGFDKAAQARLAAAGQKFVELLHGRGKERAEAKKEQAARMALLDALRTETSYFRRAGRAAVGKGPGREDFDKLVKPAPAARKAKAGQGTAQVQSQPAKAA